MKKLTYGFVKQSFAQEGYKLKNKEYVDAHQYLEYECPEGHVHKITWSNWQQNNRCPSCASGKLTFNQVKQSFVQAGYELKSKEYKNSYSYLEYKCSLGHAHKITWTNWQQGSRCPSCAKDKRKLTYKQVKQSFTDKGYSLLSKEYKNSKSHLEYKCSKGHVHKITWGHWQQGQGCQICAGKSKLKYNFVKQSFEKEGYALISKEYVNAHQYLEYKCLSGHVHKIKWNNWQQGQRCGICDIKWSKAEKEIVNYIKSIYNGTVIENDRSLIVSPFTGRPMEFDIWLPDINKAIEYNGHFWHNTDEAKAKDKYKKQWCMDNDIDLLVINDQEWLANKDWDMINKFIGVQNEKSYHRTICT